MKFLISILSLLSVALVGRAAPASLDGIQYKTTPFRLFIKHGREREYIKAVNNSLVLSSESQNLACARTPYPNEATFYLQNRLLFLYSNQEPRQRVYVKADGLAFAIHAETYADPNQWTIWGDSLSCNKKPFTLVEIDSGYKIMAAATHPSPKPRRIYAEWIMDFQYRDCRYR